AHEHAEPLALGVLVQLTLDGLAHDLVPLRPVLVDLCRAVEAELNAGLAVSEVDHDARVLLDLASLLAQAALPPEKVVLVEHGDAALVGNVRVTVGVLGGQLRRHALLERAAELLCPAGEIDVGDFGLRHRYLLGELSSETATHNGVRTFLSALSRGRFINSGPGDALPGRSA